MQTSILTPQFFKYNLTVTILHSIINTYCFLLIKVRFLNINSNAQCKSWAI